MDFTVGRLLRVQRPCTHPFSAGNLARNANQRQANLKAEIRKLLTEGLGEWCYSAYIFGFGC